MKGATCFRISAVKNVKAYEANIRRTLEYMEHIGINSRYMRTELTRLNEVMTLETLEGGSLTSISIVSATSARRKLDGG